MNTFDATLARFLLVSRYHLGVPAAPAHGLT